MQDKTQKRNILQRILGICATNMPLDEGCWTFENGKIVVDLNRVPELAGASGAIRLEEKDLTERILVFQGEDGQYYAFQNSCPHIKRRLDPLPGKNQVQCCSLGQSTFDYAGKLVSGSAQGDVQTYAVSVESNRLLITL